MIAGGVLVVGLITFGWRKILTAAALALAAWLIFGALAILGRRWWAGRAELGRTVTSTPPALFGLVLAHAGLGLLTLGVSGVTAWQSDKVLTMNPGDTVAFAGRTLTLDALDMVDGPNYRARQARFIVKGRGGDYPLVSERRVYASSQTTEAGIHVAPLGNLYVSVGDELAGGVVVRLWDHPLIIWIWMGGFTMALGGLVSLSDRRLRLGAPSRVVVRPPVAAAPIPGAAE